MIWTAIGVFLVDVFLLWGLTVVNPNQAAVCLLFGDYKGTIKSNGFYWVNPFYTEQKISLRARNLNGERLKVNDLAGNPIEIAGAMLQRQQASAVVAARQKIVEGAVGMVELALSELSSKSLVQLDEERKATMISNLLVVLCSEHATQPVTNTGTLYQKTRGGRERTTGWLNAKPFHCA